MAGGIDGHPFGMGLGGIVAEAMRIDPRDDGHVQLAAAVHQVAENIFVAQPVAAMVKGHFGGVVGDMPPAEMQAPSAWVR